MKKGQVISIDFLLSVGIIILAIGMLLNLSESNAYTKKQEQIFQEIKSIGTAAAENLILSNNTTCEIKNEKNETTLNIPNCIDSTKLTNYELVAEILGINTTKYEFTLFDSDTTPLIKIGNIKNEGNIYSETRKAYILSEPIKKTQFDNCLYGDRTNCPLIKEKEITLRVKKI